MLKNVTAGISIDSKVTYLKSIKDKAFGAIKFNDKILHFETRFGVHSFFVKAPIDIIVLDKDRRVVKIKESLLPKRIFLWNPKYFLILELPKGSIEKLKLKLGHIVEFNL